MCVPVRIWYSDSPHVRRQRCHLWAQCVSMRLMFSPYGNKKKTAVKIVIAETPHVRGTVSETGNIHSGLFIWIKYVLVKDSSDRNDRTVRCIVCDLDTAARVAGMNDLVVAHVKSHMTAVADDITRLCGA